jgi:hypothetical protein
MKSYIKKLLRENLGYRAGDLINKAEVKSMFGNTKRSTGHFGTGFYFFGNEDDAKEYGRVTGDRGVSVINLDGYNLAKGTYKLHELLSDVNTSTSDDYLELSIKQVLAYFGKLKKEANNYRHIRNSNDYNNLSGQDKIAYDNEMNNNMSIHYANKNMINNIIDKIHSNGGDSPSTTLMKSIGFDGVDVRGTELDNARYGSVVYDIK